MCRDGREYPVRVVRESELKESVAETIQMKWRAERAESELVSARELLAEAQEKAVTAAGNAVFDASFEWDIPSDVEVASFVESRIREALAVPDEGKTDV